MFVLIDLCVFALLFLTFVVEQSAQPAVFAQSRAMLDAPLGLANTIVLLTSSWFMALAVHAAREGAQVWASRFVVLAISTGVMFVGIKSAEYAAKFADGISPVTNDFFMYYFIITFIHFFHVIAGIAVLSAVLLKVRRGGYGAGRSKGIETAATYWHMVDLLWVMLFPLLYLAEWR